jgi:hypothetical protein
MNPLTMPLGAFSAAPAVGTAQLPSAPPNVARGGLWDPGNRHRTLLALGTGLLSGRNLSEGAALAGQNMLGLEGQLAATQRKTREFGGPDNSFEIITDPETGERTYRPVEEFQGYLREKATKPKDVADMNGRVMFAIQQLPEEQRATAYAGVLANPERYGVDAETMPPTYDPTYASVTSGMGMTVSQALTRQQAASNAKDMKDYRADVHADRQERTGIYRARAAATTAQGEQRLAISRSKGSGKAPSKGGRKVAPANDDLSYLLN